MSTPAHHARGTTASRTVHIAPSSVVIASAQRENDRSRWARILWTGAVLLTICAILIFMLRGTQSESYAQYLAGTSAQTSQTTLYDPEVALNAPESLEIGLEWDGPTLSFDWRGQERLATEISVLGAPVVVPGDHIQHTLLVRNDGPTAAVLDAWIDPEQLIPENAQNTELASDVELFWEIDGLTGSQTFSELLEQDITHISQVQVEQGETLAVTVGMRVDAGVERSQNAGVDSTLLEFDLGLAMSGERVADTTPLAITGGIHPWMLILGAVVLFGGGLLLLVWRRRRDEEEDEFAVETVGAAENAAGVQGTTRYLGTGVEYPPTKFDSGA